MGEQTPRQGPRAEAHRAGDYPRRRRCDYRRSEGRQTHVHQEKLIHYLYPKGTVVIRRFLYFHEKFYLLTSTKQVLTSSHSLGRIEYF